MTEKAAVGSLSELPRDVLAVISDFVCSNTLSHCCSFLWTLFRLRYISYDVQDFREIPKALADSLTDTSGTFPTPRVKQVSIYPTECEVPTYPCTLIQDLERLLFNGLQAICFNSEHNNELTEYESQTLQTWICDEILIPNTVSLQTMLISCSGNWELIHVVHCFDTHVFPNCTSLTIEDVNFRTLTKSFPNLTALRCGVSENAICDSLPPQLRKLVVGVHTSLSFFTTELLQSIPHLAELEIKCDVQTRSTLVQLFPVVFRNLMNLQVFEFAVNEKHPPFELFEFPGYNLQEHDRLETLSCVFRSNVHLVFGHLPPNLVELDVDHVKSISFPTPQHRVFPDLVDITLSFSNAERVDGSELAERVDCSELVKAAPNLCSLYLEYVKLDGATAMQFELLKYFRHDATVFPANLSENFFSPSLKYVELLYNSGVTDTAIMKAINLLKKLPNLIQLELELTVGDRVSNRTMDCLEENIEWLKSLSSVQIIMEGTTCITKERAASFMKIPLPSHCNIDLCTV